MSQYFAVRSHGDPYFGAHQINQAFMDSSTGPSTDLSASGHGFVLLDLAVHALPVMQSSADELHALFSYHEYGPSGATIVEFGITPNGRIKAQNRASGGYIQTVSGAIVPGGGFMKLAYQFEPVSHSLIGWDWADETDSGLEPGYGGDHHPTTAYATAAYAPSTPVVGPASGKTAMFLLFNGKEARTRCECSIRFARACFQDATHPRNVQWEFSEGRLESISGEMYNSTAFSSEALAFNPNLNLVYYDPLVYPLLYGGLPTNNVRESYRWDNRTIYRRRALAPASYRKVAQA